MLKNAKNYQVVLFVVLNIAINYAGKEVAEYFQWPVWLDTAGTVIAAYVLGPLAGAVAGMKLEEMIQDGRITPDQAKIGYVGAYPYPEVMRKIKRAQPQPSTIFCRM